MRYFPLNAKNRMVDTGNIHWNKRYLRGLQVILNVMRGSVMPGADFFYQAFGETPEEFKSILMMPDEFIRNRLKPNWQKINERTKRLMPYVKKWRVDYRSLSTKERKDLINILAHNERNNIRGNAIKNKKVRKLIEYHLNAEDIVSKNGNGQKKY